MEEATRSLSDRQRRLVAVVKQQKDQVAKLKKETATQQSLLRSAQAALGERSRELRVVETKLESALVSEEAHAATLAARDAERVAVEAAAEREREALRTLTISAAKGEDTISQLRRDVAAAKAESRSAAGAVTLADEREREIARLKVALGAARAELAALEASTAKASAKLGRASDNRADSLAAQVRSSFLLFAQFFISFVCSYIISLLLSERSLRSSISCEPR